jgi:hypothetical protein
LAFLSPKLHIKEKLKSKKTGQYFTVTDSSKKP